MSDHYVKVHQEASYATNDSKDALQALESYGGLQTHRSWWVATDAIEKVTK